jgi:hypothetical protein
LLSNKVINKLEINSILFMKIKIDIFIDEIWNGRFKLVKLGKWIC